MNKDMNIMSIVHACTSKEKIITILSSYLDASNKSFKVLDKFVLIALSVTDNSRFGLSHFTHVTK